MPSRADAWSTVCEFTPGDSLRRHMMSVEAVMRAYARRYEADEDLWGVVGLLHDFDYESFPDEHPQGGERILAERGWPPEVRRAVMSHAEHSAVPRITTLEKALHACDEITGLIIAVALVRPDKDLRQVKVSSVRKKWKDRSFAGGVDRDDIESAVAELGVPLDEHIAVVLSAMQDAADTLGLAGSD